MKLAFSTLPCMDYSAGQLKELCDKYGIDAAEVRIRDDGSFQHGDGLTVVDIGSSVSIKEYNEEQLGKAKKILKQASDAGFEGVRFFLGTHFKKHSERCLTLNHGEIVRMLQELCDSTDIEVWVETHNEFSTGRELDKLLKAVDRKNIKIIWDIVHPIEDGESPEDTLRYLGKNIAHVHIKDGKKRQDPDQLAYEYTPLGEGQLPIKEIVALLEESGYDGYYSLEWEDVWRPELKQLGWSVDEILDKFVRYMRG